MASESSNLTDRQIDAMLRTFDVEPSELIRKSFTDFLTDIYNRQKNSKTENEYRNILIDSIFGRDFPFCIASRYSGKFPSQKGYKTFFDIFQSTYSNISFKYLGYFAYIFELRSKEDTQFVTEIEFRIKYNAETEEATINFKSVIGMINFRITPGKSEYLITRDLLMKCYDFISKKETWILIAASEYDISFEDIFLDFLSKYKFPTDEPSEKKRSRTE